MDLLLQASGGPSAFSFLIIALYAVIFVLICLLLVAIIRYLWIH